MLEPEMFNALVDRIVALGYDEDTAADFAVQVGDTPERDEQGRVLVRDRAGRQVALELGEGG